MTQSFPNTSHSIHHRLPSTCDANSIRASLTNGLLRIDIPKKAVVKIPVPIRSSAPLERQGSLLADQPKDDEETAHHARATLLLPGFGAEHLSAEIVNDHSVQAPQLHVKGESPNMGKVFEVVRLPKRADVDHASASMVNGVFSFTVPVLPADKVHIEVASSAPKDDDQLVGVFSMPVPGLGAADLEAEALERSLVLRQKASKGNKVNVQLPRGTDLRAIKVSVEHGVLQVHTKRPEKAAEINVAIAG